MARLHPSLIALLLPAVAHAVPITAGTQFLAGTVVTDLMHDVSDGGDGNLDGIPDLLLGDPLSPAAGPIAGAAFMDYGGTPGLSIGGPVRFIGAAAGDRFGTSVDGLGDVNCDGVTDVIIGAPNNGLGAPGAGTVFVFLGPFFPGSYPAMTAGSILHGTQPNEGVGTSVTFTRDHDGDGCSDILIGAPGHDDVSGLADTGAGFLVGSATLMPGPQPLVPPFAQVIEGDQPGARTGTSVADGGDHNGDGVPDLVLGAPGWSGNGAAFVALGPIPPGYSYAPPISMTYLGQAPGDAFGFSVDGGRDADLDGRDDILVGAPRHNNGGVMWGAGAAYFASSAWNPVAPGVVAPAMPSMREWTGLTQGGQLGYDVAFLYDVNNDLVEDFAFSAPFQNWAGGSGRVFGMISPVAGLAPGVSTPVPGAAHISAVPNFIGVGFAIDRARDSDLDGRPDPLIGWFRTGANRNGLSAF